MGQEEEGAISRAWTHGSHGLRALRTQEGVARSSQLLGEWNESKKRAWTAVIWVCIGTAIPG